MQSVGRRLVFGKATHSFFRTVDWLVGVSQVYVTPLIFWSGNSSVGTERLRANGVAVALVLELMSCHPTLPDDAPPSSYRTGSEVKVLKYGRAKEALTDSEMKREKKELLV